MPKSFWVADGFAHSMSVLDMAFEIADARVKDVVEGILAKKKIADDSHAACVLVVYPQSTQVSYCVDCLLELHKLLQEIVEWHVSMPTNLTHQTMVLLYKAYYCFPVIFRDVLCLIFTFFFTLFLLNIVYFLLLLIAVFILRDALLLGDHP